MGRKKYTSARGTPVNWDELLLKNKNVIAVSNTAMNAMGDRLGPGGKVVQKASDVKYQLPPTNAAYNKNNPKAVKLVSLKDDLSKIASDSSKKMEAKYGKEVMQGEGARLPQEVMKDLRTKNREEKAKNTALQLEETPEDDQIKETNKSSQNKRKIVDSE